MRLRRRLLGWKVRLLTPFSHSTGIRTTAPTWTQASPTRRLSNDTWEIRLRANQPLTREKVKRDTQRVLRVSKNRLPTVQLVASVRVYESTPGTTLGVGLYSPHLWISLWIGV